MRKLNKISGKLSQVQWHMLAGKLALSLNFLLLPITLLLHAHCSCSAMQCAQRGHGRRPGDEAAICLLCVSSTAQLQLCTLSNWIHSCGQDYLGHVDSPGIF